MMHTKLLSSSIWSKITAAVKKNPSECHVAVAYFGTGAKSLLPLQEGSSLVVDMSESAVRAGQTNPSDILTLVNRGVHVYSVRNLHAKVFVVGKKAFVGSTNVSHNSADGLVEAVVQTDSPSVVAACRGFVTSLQGELVTPQTARNLRKLYQPPRFSGGRQRQARHTQQRSPLHSPLWLVPLVLNRWDDEDRQELKKGMPIAKKRLRSTKEYIVDDFSWDSGTFSKKLRHNDLVLQVLEHSNGTVMVLPPSRAVYIRRYRKGQKHSAIIYLERRKGSCGKNLSRVKKSVGRSANVLRDMEDPKRLRDDAVAHALLNLWNSGNGK